jgi:hypothetical protein
MTSNVNRPLPRPCTLCLRTRNLRTRLKTYWSTLRYPRHNASRLTGGVCKLDRMRIRAALQRRPDCSLLRSRPLSQDDVEAYSRSARRLQISNRFQTLAGLRFAQPPAANSEAIRCAQVGRPKHRSHSDCQNNALAVADPKGVPLLARLRVLIRELLVRVASSSRRDYVGL